MDFTKDNCAFCFNTTIKAPTITQEYIKHLAGFDKLSDGTINFIQKLDVLLPLYSDNKNYIYGIRKGKYCGMMDCNGSIILDLSYKTIIPPYQCNVPVFILQDKNGNWGAVRLSDSQKTMVIVPFGTYKYMWGFDNNHCLVHSKECTDSKTFHERGIIDSKGQMIIPFHQYADIWNFYKTNLPFIKAETFDGYTLQLSKQDPTIY